MGWLKEVKAMLSQVEAGSYSARSWICSGRLRAYVRVTRHKVNGALADTIDVASIEVDEAHRGKGTFTRWLAKVEALAREHHRTVYVESVLQERLVPFLIARGYHTVSHADRCYAKEP